MELQVEGLYFCAAHRLMHHKGKCSHFHGHNFHTLFTFYGEDIDSESGMLVDFSIIKQIVAEEVDALDHCSILNIEDKKFVDFIRKQENKLIVLGNEPSVEEISKFLYTRLDKAIDSNSATSGKIVLTEVKIWETPKFSATYGIEDAEKA